MTRPRSPAGTGALAVIAMLFIASAASRGFDGGERGWSALRGFLDSRAHAATDGSEPPARESLDGELPEVLAALAAREADIGRREALLAERRRALELADAEVRANLQALAEAEAALRETIALADGAAQRDLESLTRMFETMKPREAAGLFEAMDATFAAGFLAEMTPAAAARILEGLPPETAYLISSVMAGRNVRVPTE